jgi:hypothetical protein
MAKVFKLLVLLAAVGGLLTAASYAAARFTAGKVTGSKPPLSNRTIVFQGWRPPGFEGVADLPGKPRAWVIQYGRTQLPGVRRATIYVSPAGKLITTVPRDLDTRIEAWERAQEPGS